MADTEDQASGGGVAAVSFKKRKQRQQLRTRRTLTETPAEDVTVEDRLAEAKEDQKMRERAQGVSTVGLILGKDTAIKAKADANAWSLERGGVMPAHLAARDRDRDRDNEDDRVYKGITNTFAAETGKRDQDAEMLEYIEKKMQEEQGHDGDNTRRETEYERLHRQLYQVPEELSKIQAQEDDEKVGRGMLSNAILSGIPEVDLGVESKMKNIEDTEAAKERLLQARSKARAERQADDGDGGPNYAASIFGYGAARKRQQDRSAAVEPKEERKPRLSTAEQFALAKQRAMSEGKAETVKYDQLPPDQAEVKRRSFMVHGASDDVEVSKYKKRFRRY